MALIKRKISILFVVKHKMLVFHRLQSHLSLFDFQNTDLGIIVIFFENKSKVTVKSISNKHKSKLQLMFEKFDTNWRLIHKHNNVLAH